MFQDKRSITKEKREKEAYIVDLLERVFVDGLEEGVRDGVDVSGKIWDRHCNVVQ